MFSILVWTVLLGVLFLVGMLVFLLDRLQTISNVARFGPPKDYMDKLETKRKRRMALEKSKRSASNQLLLSGLSESQNGSNDRQTTGEKPARKSLEGRILWNVLSGKKTSKRTEEDGRASAFCGPRRPKGHGSQLRCGRKPVQKLGRAACPNIF